MTQAKKTGRPQKKIDAALVGKLARIGCSDEEIADFVGCNRSTLYRRFATAIRKGREVCKRRLRRWQLKRAKAGSDTMLIWLGKQMLKQTDKVNNDVTVTLPALTVQVID
jgi:hypothetical protein